MECRFEPCNLLFAPCMNINMRVFFIICFVLLFIFISVFRRFLHLGLKLLLFSLIYLSIRLRLRYFISLINYFLFQGTYFIYRQAQFFFELMISFPAFSANNPASTSSQLIPYLCIQTHYYCYYYYNYFPRTRSCVSANSTHY